MFLGPVCDYSLAPVARYSSVWKIPIISPGGFTHSMGFKQFGNSRYPRDFPLLTRIGVTFNSLAAMWINVMKEYSWGKTKVLYDPPAFSSVSPGFCHLAASAFIYYTKSVRGKYDFHQFAPDKEDVETLLVEKVGQEFGSEYKHRLFAG